MVAEQIVDILRSTLTAAEQDQLLERMRQALASAPLTKDKASLIAAFSGGRTYSAADCVRLEAVALPDYFQRRRALLNRSLTASQVADILGTSRQTPHDRLESGSLLAVMDRGALRFPTWQFDAEGPNGAVRGLPEVIRALHVSPLAKMSWLTRANPVFDGATPLDALRRGEIEAVVDEASAVGIA